MSDPVTNVEIEDVLSSIRRLVSDGDKDRPNINENGTEWVEPAADRLVLTPAFRVEDVPAPVEAPQVAEKPEPIVLETPIEPVQAVEVEENFVEPVAEEESPEGRSLLEETIAELEAAVGSDATEWEPDGSEETEAFNTWPEFDINTVPDAEIAEEPVAEISPEPIVEDEPSIEPEIAAVSDSETVVAEPEVPEAQPEPEESVAAEPFVVPEPEVEAEAEEEVPNDDLSAYLDEESVIDEAMLRDMVAEIVREELQGPMGTRITRNVRKLVRREINLILNSQDFD